MGKPIEINADFFSSISHIKCVFKNINILEIKVRGGLKISHGECFCSEELTNNTEILYSINDLLISDIIEVTRFEK